MSFLGETGGEMIALKYRNGPVPEPEVISDTVLTNPKFARF